MITAVFPLVENCGRKHKKSDKIVAFGRKLEN